MCVMKYLKHYVKHSLTQICSMYSISISVIINIIFTTHYCLLELFHCNFIFFFKFVNHEKFKVKICSQSLSAPDIVYRNFCVAIILLEKVLEI